MTGEKKNVDLIICWVTSDDEQWQDEYLYWKNLERGEIRTSCLPHYKDWGTLRYVLRMIDQHLPWIDRVHLVTNGQKPNIAFSERVILVRHDEFMEKAGLPTFNSSAIEMQLHKIEGLRDNFIIWNDDFYLFNDLEKKDFVDNAGKLVDRLELRLRIPKALWCFRQSNTSNLEMVDNAKEKALSTIPPSLKKLLLKFILLFLDIKTWHYPQIHKKKDWLYLNNMLNLDFNNVSQQRFRKSGINQYLIRNYVLLRGAFTKRRREINMRSKSYFIECEKDIILISDSIDKGSIFVNLSEKSSIDPREISRMVECWSTLLEKRYKEKGKFEK